MTEYGGFDLRGGNLELAITGAIRLFEHCGANCGYDLPVSFKGVDVAPWIALLEAHATLVEPESLPGQVCTDPGDDMFIACALAARAHIICSGDKALLKTSGYRGIEVLKPREFADRYLPQT